jgi:hypothetical protein
MHYKSCDGNVVIFPFRCCASQDSVFFSSKVTSCAAIVKLKLSPSTFLGVLLAQSRSFYASSFLPALARKGGFHLPLRAHETYLVDNITL